jgi:hypothetical protein
LGLEREISSGTELSVAKKCDLLARIVVQRPADVLSTVEGTMTLAEAVVREAVKLTKQYSQEQPLQIGFLRGLLRDGYVVSWSEDTGQPELRAALPEEIELPATDDEVRATLEHFQFTTPLGHLEQAIEAQHIPWFQVIVNSVIGFGSSHLDLHRLVPTFHLAETAAPIGGLQSASLAPVMRGR